MDNTPQNDKKVAEGFLGQKMIVLPPNVQQLMAKNQLARSLYATALGYYPNASYHDRERKTGTAQYILLYCVEGRGWIQLNGTEYSLLPNTFFIIPQNTPNHYGSSQKEPWSIYWVHFNGLQADLLYSRYAGKANDGTQYIAYDHSRIALFDKLAGMLESDLNDVVTETVYINLLQFISSFIYTGAASEPVEQDAVSASISLMKENISRSYQIKELADHARYSVSHYSELFRRKTGFAPIQYFLQLKIQRACQYLYFTKMNIKQICGEVGFEDPFYFSRMFKKQMGQSPLQYRKMHRS
ncbi:AraC family transcriptional regulator [uncultured Mucilaginibacter sp.]|uniref:AraC family transcriptional regulator n=1 Tax=uncultured Mucilaginibacter sp. TaxID=797541 RepID=UPI0025FD0E0B|nr:AraC family transcriptional regulator [uncultured Mucilaginibacter sp.]